MASCQSRFQLADLEGAAAGVIMAGAVALGMIALGVMQVKGLAGSGQRAHALRACMARRNVCVGIAEEFWFRSYLCRALEKYRLLAGCHRHRLIFAAEHYFFKQGEELLGRDHARLAEPAPD